MARNALGRGLGALIRELEGKRSEPAPPPPQPQATATNASAVAAMPARQATQGGPQEIDIDLIEPLVLRPIGSRFQLIAGERRWRAAQRAGLNKVSAIVRQVPDELALEMTLVENIQREDLNPIEAARAFQRLMEEFDLTQDLVAERTGKDRTTVANAVRLLKLESKIQEWIEEGQLSAGHGRALLAVADPQLRMRYAQRAARGGLTVRQIERLASRRARGGHAPAEVHLDANIRSALDELQRHLGTKVLLHQKTKMRPGQLVLEFYDDGQLMGLYDRLMK